MESPTRVASATFRTKATLLQLQRMAWDRHRGIKPCEKDPEQRSGEVIASSSSPLWTDERDSEAWYQRGKIQNLRIAAARLHGTIIPAGTVFSFWKSVGRATRARGFVEGRMLQQGCMIPAVGGGLCQLSNALYDAALLAGCDIVERHAHSQVVPGSASAIDRDATVAWNYIDLRFRSSRDLQLDVQLNSSSIVVRLRGRAAETANTPSALRVIPKTGPRPNSCDSCGRVQCFRHEKPRPHRKSRTAFLVDSAWPEFKLYVASHHSAEDSAAIPLRGDRWRKGNYDWPVTDFATVHTATASTLRFAMLFKAAGRPRCGEAKRAPAPLAGTRRRSFASAEAGSRRGSRISVFAAIFMDARRPGRKATSSSDEWPADRKHSCRARCGGGGASRLANFR